jgi:hypothetical protein
MTLDQTAAHPSRHSFVVKLHRDARAADAGLQGRAENLATGRHFDFADGAGLLAGLERELARGQVLQPQDPTPDVAAAAAPGGQAPRA